MNKTVTLSDREIFEIIFALDCLADEFVEISKEASRNAIDVESVYENEMWNKISYGAKRKTYYLHSLMSKLKNL